MRSERRLLGQLQACSGTTNATTAAFRISSKRVDSIEDLSKAPVASAKVKWGSARAL